jgi:hypothetical protein
MPLQEKRDFIKDNKQNMSVREKNMRLSAKLATAPNVTRKIARIERVEIGASGWWIYYRTGSPS